VLAGAVLAGGILAAGCHSTDGMLGHGDPCWPDRYSNEARAATVANFQPQVENGEVLDQTLWNMHFEYATDKLNGSGMDKLDQIARRRPHPDPKLFLQTARDIPYDGDYANKRQDLDTKRVAAVQKYLTATLTGRPTAFDIQVHDPAYPGVEVSPGVGPRVYSPAPQDRAKGAGIPALGPISVAPSAIAVPASGGSSAGPGGGSSSGSSGGYSSGSRP
jgi:hypothetical protein